jgi:predicted MFS family arabinose efflux permease
VEGVVNERLAEDEPVRAYETTFEFARSQGALSLFGEKYGDLVRVVEIGDYSVELCGGTHVPRTGAVALALLTAFVARQARIERPLIPLSIFRSRTTSGANIVQALMVAGMFGMFFLGSLFMERVLGYGPLEIGLAFLPVALLIGILSFGFSDRLILRFGARATLIPGLVLIVAGLALFARVPVDASYVADMLAPMVLFGVGAGLSFPSLMTLAMSGVAPSESGLASGLVNTSLQVGGALGLAVLATLSTTRTENLLASGDTQAAALTSGYRVAWIIGAALIAVALAAAIAWLRPERGAEQEAGRLEELPGAEPAYSEAA